jgi:hypothetical protein
LYNEDVTVIALEYLARQGRMGFRHKGDTSQKERYLLWEKMKNPMRK